MLWRLFGTLAACSFALQSMAANLTEEQRTDLLSADIVILGEVHDNPTHHDAQAKFLAQVDPTAVVFEMLTPEMAEIANNYTETDLSGLGSAMGWSAAGWPDFKMYQPIFGAMGEAPAVGAASSRDKVRAAFQDGAAAVFGAGAVRFGLQDVLPEKEQATREELQFDAHCEAMPRDMMSGMVEAQRFRDATFAAATLRALDTHGSPVVVITGNGHARRDWGIPAMLAQAAPELRVRSIGLLEEPATAPDRRYDLTFVTRGVDRDDPCAVFQEES